MNGFDRRGARTTRGACKLLAISGMLACGGDRATGPSGPPGGGTTEQWVSVAARSWTARAQTEFYECHVEQVTTDKYFTGFRLANPPAAQTEVYLTMRPTVVQTGDYDCNLSSLLGGEEIYTAAVGTTPIAFSGGKGVYVAAGQYVMLVVHVNNTAASQVTASTTIEARVAAAKDVTTPIDMAFVGKVSFDIGASADTEQVAGDCLVANDMHIVATIPFMRSIAIRQIFEFSNDTTVNQHIADVSFDQQHIMYASLPTDLLVPATSNVATACFYVNTTGVIVSAGQTSDEEMCLTGIYRYPTKPPTINSPLDCAEGSTI